MKAIKVSRNIVGTAGLLFAGYIFLFEQAQKSEVTPCEEDGYIKAKGTRGTARVSKQGANGRTFSRSLPVLSG